MTDKQQRTLRRAYGVFLSVFTIIVGILLIVQSQRIYHSEEISPYAPQKVGEALSQIAIFLYLWLGAVVVGWVLWELFPEPSVKNKALVYQTHILKKLRARVPSNTMSEALKRSERTDTVIRYVFIIFGVFAAVMVGICVFDKSNYTPVGNSFNPTSDMLAMLPKILPWIAAFFLVAIAKAIYDEFSAKKKIQELKELFASTKPTERQKTREPIVGERTLSKIKLGLRIGLALCSVLLIVVGALNGGAKELLEKAINICTECIGLG